MEDRQVWESVFGRCYETNDDFEKDLFNNVSNKLTIICRISDSPN